jgi:PAS domain S-box-containing protein
VPARSNGLLFDVLGKILGAVLLLCVPVGLTLYFKVTGGNYSTAEEPLAHEAAVAFVVFWVSILSVLSYRCYLRSQETFLRYLTLSLLGGTITYAFHGIFTRWADTNEILFLAYGPAARLVLAGLFFVGLLNFGRRDHHLATWRYWTIAIGLLLLLPILMSVLPFESMNLRKTMFSLEIFAFVFFWGSVVIILFQKAYSQLILILSLSIVLFASSSVSFLFSVKHWDHIFWLSHFIFGVGLVFLSVCIIRSRLRAEAFDSVFTDDFLLSRLAASAEKFRKVQTVSPDVFLSLDTDGNILSVSARSESIWGYKEEDLLGRSCFFLIHPDDHQSTMEAIRKVAEGEPLTQFNNRNIRSDGQIRDMIWSAIWSESDQELVCMGRDVTDGMLAERSLQRSLRLEAIGQLTGGVAHDFNNLLQVINASLDALQESKLDQQQHNKILEQAFGAVHRGSELIGQLLTYSRQQPQARSVVDLVSIVENSLPLLQRTLGEQVQVTFESQVSNAWTLVDASQLDSAIMNLAINARDAMPDGGPLAFKVYEKIVDAQPGAKNSESPTIATQSDLPSGRYCVLEVSDKGEGMDLQTQERIFEPFFTTKDVGKGSGLGLSMVFGFMSQSEGRVLVDSTPGQGTTFYLYFKAEQKEPREAKKSRPDVKMDGTNVGRVLIVEDNEMVSAAIVKQISSAGYSVQTASSGIDALAILEKDSGFDLLFTDVVMPGGLDGIALAEKAEQLNADMKILLTSGFSNTYADKHHYSMLPKPYRKKDLIEAIQALVPGDS